MFDTPSMANPDISLVRSDDGAVIGVVMQCDDGGKQAQVVSIITGAPVEVPSSPRIIRMVGCRVFIEWLAVRYPLRGIEDGDQVPDKTTHVIQTIMPIPVEQDDIAFPFHSPATTRRPS